MKKSNFSECPSLINLCSKTRTYGNQKHSNFSSSVYTLSRYEILFARKEKDDFILSMSTNSNSMPNEKSRFQEKKEGDSAVSKLQISSK